jgi:hypothetical protein
MIDLQTLKTPLTSGQTYKTFFLFITYEWTK